MHYQGSDSRLTYSDDPKHPPLSPNHSAPGTGGVVGDEGDTDSRKGTCALVQEFCETTTAHGWCRVGKLHARGGITGRLLWTALTIAAYGFLVIHVTFLMIQYLQYPSEQVSRVELASIPFPSVTVCSIYPMSLSTRNTLLQDNTTEFSRWTRITTRYLQSLLDEGRYEEYEEMKNRLQGPVGYFENIGYEARTVGHQPYDLILRCLFSLEECGPKNFSYYQDPTYYNCYTFNSRDENQPQLVARTTGPQQGLSLVMYIEADNADGLSNGTYYSFSNVGNAAGARVVVHPPNTRPSPLDHGFDIPPGFSSSVGLTVVQHDRLSAPYGDCKDTDTMTTDTGDYSYSDHGCLMECQQRLVIDECNCQSSQLPLPDSTDKPKISALPTEAPHTLHYCGEFNASRIADYFSNLSCEVETMTKFAQSKKTREICGCYPPCVETTYNTQVSYSYWPIDFTQEDFFNSYVMRHTQSKRLKAFSNLSGINMSELIAKGLIRKNFLRLNVYLQDLTIEQIIQKKTYELQNLFSDIGGTLGLWIGVSILTLFELMELLTYLSYRLLHKMCPHVPAANGNAGNNVTHVKPYNRDKSTHL